MIDFIKKRPLISFAIVLLLICSGIYLFLDMAYFSMPDPGTVHLEKGMLTPGVSSGLQMISSPSADDPYIPNERHVYTYAGKSGETIRITATEDVPIDILVYEPGDTSANDYPLIRYRDDLEGGPGRNPSVEVTLCEDGIYRIEVEGLNAVTEYEIQVDVIG